MSAKVIDEGIPWGVYVAYSRGKMIVNEERSPLNIPARRGDRNRINQLIKTAESFGLDEITVKFVEGSRRVTEEEYEEQHARLASGEVPDKYDLGNMIEEYKYREQNGLL